MDLSKGSSDRVHDKERFDENHDRINWLQAKATLREWTVGGFSEPVTEKVLRAARFVVASTPEIK